MVTRPATTEAPAKEGTGRAVAIAAFPAVVVVVVAVAIGAALGSPIVGLVVAVVLGAAVWAGVWFGAERLIVGRLGGSFVEDDDVPRAANLVDGLCATMGLPLPALFLVDDPFRGALAVGRNERSATLVLTTGLLRALDPVELEGVLAHELSHVKSGDMATGTMAAAVVLPLAPILSGSPELVRKLAGSGRELAADVSGVVGDAVPAGTSRCAREDVRRSFSCAAVGACEPGDRSRPQMALDGRARAPCSGVDDRACSTPLRPESQLWTRRRMTS